MQVKLAHANEVVFTSPWYCPSSRWLVKLVPWRELDPGSKAAI